MRLSVVMPVYNEKAFVKGIIEKVLSVHLPGIERELIVVNDCSKDGTREVLESLDLPGVRVFHHEQNRGKGAALRTGFAQATGDIILVQDADMEYNPEEYPVLLKPILDGHADVVYGSRFLSGPHRVHLFWHMVGNKILTLLSNMMSNLNLTDMETCYKVFRRDVLRGITLRSDRFGFEPEFTLKVARGGWRVYEVPISYHGRDYAEGKKIGWKDGVSAVYTIIKYRLMD
ncbi:MAG TPA: glycosyltransferase family 2 protein [Candidatus Polarisedimenticolia bacterium]|nr:glycosyltransferase family 2 protein [Candidatus Polarisedimenticolia bacterium]